MRRAACGAVVAACLWLGSCAAPPGEDAASFTVSASEYGRVFESAKGALRGAGFELARVDARNGVITTRPLQGAGLATPWVGTETTWDGAVESTLNAQRRWVRVEFDGVEGAGAERVTVRTLVVVDRVYSPGRRVESSSVRRSGYWTEPELVAREMQPDFVASVRRDEGLAARLGEAIRSGAGVGGAGETEPE